LPYVGPAAALPVFGALARLPHGVAVRLWSGCIALAVAGLVLAALALARTSRILAFFAAMTLAFASGPGMSAVGLGQTALIAAAGVALALLFYGRRHVALGALVTLAAGLQPNLALALLPTLRDRTAWIAATLGGTLFASLTLAAGGGLAGLVSYLRRIAEHADAERFVAIQYTPAALAWSFGAPASIAIAIGAAVALLAVVSVVAATLRARLDARDGTLLGLATIPLAVPFFHEHDFVVALLPAIVLALNGRERVRAWAGIASACILVDWFGLAQRPLGNGQILAQACAVAAAFVALGPGKRVHRADLASIVATLALAAFALPLARAHAAPTWPDALPATYRAPANAGASAVWRDEQRAAGLERREPAWGALRAIPLAGCVALGVAVVLYGRRRCTEDDQNADWDGSQAGWIRKSAPRARSAMPAIGTTRFP
jgi:hypothetical protein